jgi:hypothetical protein
MLRPGSDSRQRGGAGNYLLDDGRHEHVPPQYAAILAIIAQKSGKRQGLINPKLYAMAKANLKNPTAVGLIDIVKGNNAFAPVPGYAAKKGFDLASAWGAIDLPIS